MSMTLTPSTPLEKDITRPDGAWYRRVGGLHVLKVKGSFYEMGRQHGELLASSVPKGALPYWTEYIEKMLRQAGLGNAAPRVRRILRRFVGRRIEKNVPDFARESLRGLAEGAGIPFSDVMDGCVMPETLLWMVTRDMQLLRIKPAVEHRLALGLGCSSAIAWGEATSDGKLLHARNFDFHGVATWPTQAAVIFHEPNEGQRYVAVSSAGVPLGGVQSMNESGLSLAVHQHMFSDETRLGGIPAGVMGDIVMRQARNLDEAKEILLSYKPIGCFTYIVTDAKTREVLCVEESPRRKAVIRTTPEYTSFSYANIYFDADLGSREKNLYPSYWRHNQGRQERLRECLALGHGSLDPAAMAGIIADTGGDGCRIRRSVAMLMTVASVVFSPEDGKLWVADGETPTSHGTFLPFSLADEDHAPSLGALRPADEIARPAREGFAAYRSAYLAFVDGGDPRQARQHIESARKLQPQESLYHFMAGLVSLLLEDAEDAALAVSRAIELGHPDPERVATFHLWRARALDILGRRDEALDDYRVPAEANRCDPEVRKAAQKGQRVSYRGKAARRINPEFSFADVVRP